MNQPKYSHSELLQIWAMYRGKIVAEDTLINHRMTWMLWAEATLYAMWGALEAGFLTPAHPGKPPEILIVVAMIVVSATGALVAVWTIWSVGAAREELGEIKKHYKENHPDLYRDNSSFPKLHGGSKTHDHGHITARCLPSCFLLMQIVTIAFSITSYSFH